MLLLRLSILVSPFNCFLDHPRHPLCPDSLPVCPPLTEQHRYLHTILPPLPVLDHLSNWKSVHSQRPPLPVPALAILLPSTCSPCPCQTIQPHTVSLFRPPLPPSSRPPFAAPNVAIVPVNPCEFALQGSGLLPPFLEPPPLPAILGLQPGLCRSRGGSCLQFLASCLPPPFFLFSRSCDSPSLGVFW